MPLVRFRLLVLFGFVLFLIACSAPPSPTPTPIFALPTQGIIVAPGGSDAITPLAANPTDVGGTPAVTQPVTSTTPIAINVTPPATSAAPANTTPTAGAPLAAGTMRVKIFMVALNDAGKTGKKIGCDDSIVAIDRTIPMTQGVLTAALNELFSVHDKTVGTSGLYNALSQSTLRIDGINLVSGRATIQITGKLVSGGVCDNPRIKAQIEETALQFPTVKSVAVTINGVAIDKVLSEK